MKLSIIIPVLNSHEIVRRQLLHFKKMNLPDDIEIIIVDDGSDPPLEESLEDDEDEIVIIPTNDKRQWTQPKARNVGADYSTGDTLLFTDVDHIITKQAVEFGRSFPYDYGRFKRELGVIDEHGGFTQDPETLMSFGLSKDKAYGKLRISCHTLSMYIRRRIFRAVGKFREKSGSYPTHDDGNMKKKLNRIGAIKCPDDERAMIYMFPNGRYCGEKDFNPFGYFHGLKRA